MIIPLSLRYCILGAWGRGLALGGGAAFGGTNSDNNLAFCDPELGRGVLIGLREIEGPDRIAMLAAEILDGAETAVLPVFSHLNYLFYGRAATAPWIWFFGGVTDLGLSVTGSGPDRRAGLMAVAGEVAEAHLAGSAHSDLGADNPAQRGIGAGPSAGAAARHAACELAERVSVQRWWAGAAPALGPLDQSVLSEAQGQVVWSDRARETVLMHLADLGEAQVVVAASFEAAGGDFCFGAACRDSLNQAAYSATNEMVQAEIGLEIARLKTTRASGGTPARADKLALDLAATVTKDVIFSSHLLRAGPIGDMIQADEDFLTGIETTPLGLFENALHVAEAALLPQAAILAHAPNAQAPFGHLDLY